MITRLKSKLAGIGTAIIVATGLAAPIYALSNNPASNDNAENHTTTAQAETENNNSSADNDQKEGQEGRLNNARKKVCQTKQSTLNKIMQDAAAAGQRHLNVFNGAATRIEQFYTTKKLTVANYDQLVADINAKKASAISAVNSVKTGSILDCNGSNPVGGISGFKTKVQAMHQALQEYRSAITNLLTAIKNSVGGNQ